MTMSAKTLTAEQQKHLDNLVKRCMVFTDYNGKVLWKSSSPFHSSLRMKYSCQGLTIDFEAGMGQGFWVKVKQQRKIVLSASGKLMSDFYDITASTYVHGKWEKKIPPLPQKK